MNPFESKETFVAKISRHALRALLYEVSVTPKPGLVDRANSGAHKDMDYFTFIDAICGFSDYFAYVTLAGMSFSGRPKDMLPVLRPLGILAEQDMLSATNGVNTHKGAIFSMGLLCACAGYLHGQGESLTIEDLLAACAKVASSISFDSASDSSRIPSTNGGAAYKNHGITGIRGEAAAGFPSVKKAFSVLKKLLAEGQNLNDAGAITLMHLIACTDDTNIVARAGSSVLREIQARATRIVDTPQSAELLKEISTLDAEFIERNISPGGSADLLAAVFFLHFLVDN